MTLRPHDDKPPLTRMQMAFMRRLSSRDLRLLAVIFLAGILAAWTGQMAGYHMSPEGATEISGFLDDLELPRQLPNETVQSDQGKHVLLWSLASDDRNIVTVYAPWCDPCQKELPKLYEALKDGGNLVILVSKDEDMGKVRDQLKNLGLEGVHFYRDISGRILAQSKVKSLPTTFLTTGYGKVLDRVVGFSEYRLERIIKRVNPEIND